MRWMWVVGGGSQSVRLAQELGDNATVLGVDISAPMLKVALEKAEAGGAGHGRLQFLQVDASTHTFPPDSFDLLFSRFGVMFFDDPQGAFTNLRSALRPDARLVFCCWQALKDNDWTWLPLQTALKHIPPPEKQDPHAPGPFAFADPARLEPFLSGSGFGNIKIAPATTQMRFEGSTGLAGAIQSLVKIGPLARLLDGQSEDTKSRVFLELEQEMAPYYIDGGLNLPGAVWLVTANAV